MKYRLKVYYQTEATRKTTECMARIFDDWGGNGKQLEICRGFEFETDGPLSDEQKAQLVGLKEAWMEHVELEEIT